MIIRFINCFIDVFNGLKDQFNLTFQGEYKNIRNTQGYTSHAID